MLFRCTRVTNAQIFSEMFCIAIIVIIIRIITITVKESKISKRDIRKRENY